VPRGQLWLTGSVGAGHRVSRRCRRRGHWRTCASDAGNASVQVSGPLQAAASGPHRAWLFRLPASFVPPSSSLRMSLSLFHVNTSCLAARFLTRNLNGYDFHWHMPEWRADAAEAFAKVNEAYHVLFDPHLRSLYDAKVSGPLFVSAREGVKCSTP